MTEIHQSIETPIRESLSWNDRWEKEDKGLINCWEVGRTTALRNSDLADAAKNGELPELHFEGGIAGNPEKPNKYGHLNYYAMWLGLRNESLLIDLDSEYEVTCSRTGITKTFTADLLKIEPINVYFTGFSDSKNDELIAAAKKVGYKVSEKVIQNLYFLISGPEPDPSVVKKAEKCGAKIISAKEWEDELSKSQEKTS